ncbi:MAG: DEAD/DEAH box helicase [Desulfomonilaceae bacterium]
MTNNPFYRLSPFIQEYIYAQGWTEMRSVQVEACKVIFATDSHLLLSAGTASGKTEAAFLPILTLLQESMPESIGVLYIGPLKALINDQFVRLKDLLKEAQIQVWQWHGDVSQSHKKKLLKTPRGVLQITPESLESLLINKRNILFSLFNDLRFVVIDEIHAFMSVDRGRQILCQLERLSKFIRESPRRVGLSATLGDFTEAENWLCSGTTRSVITPKVASIHSKVRLAVEVCPKNSEKSPEKIKACQADEHIQDSTSPTESAHQSVSLEEYVFTKSWGKKCLVFTNNRQEAEGIVSSLRQKARNNKMPDIYHVHHGSISAPLREAAERAMRDPILPAVTAATVTLELGIDIGQLERVIQIGATNSVGNFVQRLGRSGRRNSPPEMFFVIPDHVAGQKDLLPDQIPWDLIQCIAIIQLYLEEHWIEPIRKFECPFSLLYHQTMSIMVSAGELNPQELARTALNLSVFNKILVEDFKTLILHLIEMDHLQRTDEGSLIVGLEGERIVRDFHFYSVFPENDEFTVKEGSSEIGSIAFPPPPGERFGLAGRSWEVTEIDVKRKVVFAKRVRGRVSSQWFGGTGEIHRKILQKMRLILSEDKDYPYLQSQARLRLAEARWISRNTNLTKEPFVFLGGDSFCVFPWLGTVGYRTLERLLKSEEFGQFSLTVKGGKSPYYLILNVEHKKLEDIIKKITTLIQAGFPCQKLLKQNESFEMQKYDEFVPESLLRKAFSTDYLSMAELDGLI